MSDYGVFEASSTDGHEEEQHQRQAQRDLGRAIEAAREAFGDFLGAATDKQDYKDRLALVMNDLMQSVADSGVMPVPGVMRKVKAALRPEFRTASRKTAAPGFDPNISDEDLLAGLQIAEALNHDGSNQAKVDELRAEARSRGILSSRKQAETFQPGDKVTKSGYPGTVLNEYMDGMYEVKLENGTVVVPAEELTRVSSRKQAGTVTIYTETMTQEDIDFGASGEVWEDVYDNVDVDEAADILERHGLVDTGNVDTFYSQDSYMDPYSGNVESVSGAISGFSPEEENQIRGRLRSASRTSSRKTASRSLSEIAAEIRADWKNVYFGAEPYLDAMSSLDSIDDSYGQDSAKSIVAYFLSNATSWRGETARRVKKELKELSKRRAHKTADQWDDEINRSIDEYLNSSPGGAPQIAPHPEYGEGVWSDEGVKQRVLSLDPNLPTPELVDAIMREMGDFYDSIDRELAFWYFSQVTGNDYDDYYNAWMAMPSGKYFSRKQAHNGWSNYETWEVASILDNDETAQQELAQGVSDVTHLRDIGEFYAQGNGIDFGQVDWQEIYDSFRGDGVFAKRKTADQWDDAVAAAIADGGFTFRNAPGDGPTSGYMVSTNPESERVIPTATLTPQAVRDYINEFGGTLNSSDKYIGGWDDGGNFYLDISTHVQDKEEAIELAKQYNQLAIWDIAAMDEIRTASLKQAGSAQVLQKLEDALDDQRNVDVTCSNSPDGSFSGEREIPVDEGLQKVRGWVSAGDLVDTAQDGGNFFDFEHRASGENVNFYITQEY